MEHLADPASQIEIFNEIMDYKSIALFNWYFYKGENNEYPFHLEDIQIVEKVFKALQLNFLEVFTLFLLLQELIRKLVNYIYSFSTSKISFNTIETYSSFFECKKCIIFTFAYIDTW